MTSSRCTDSAGLTLARVRPALKIGATAVAPTLHSPARAVSRPDNARLSTPSMLVRLMRGKYSARAAPICAFAAINCCSASPAPSLRHSRGQRRQEQQHEDHGEAEDERLASFGAPLLR